MRLSTQKITTIVDTTCLIAEPNARVWLYGSRLDDTRHGGDIDLLIEPTSAIGLLHRVRIKTIFGQKLNLSIDVLVKNPDTPESPFVAIARAHANEMTRPYPAQLPMRKNGCGIGKNPDPYKRVKNANKINDVSWRLCN